MDAGVEVCVERRGNIDEDRVFDVLRDSRNELLDVFGNPLAET